MIPIILVERGGMRIIHLRPAAVALLDALRTGQDLAQSLAEFQAERHAARAWLAYHGAYSVHDEERAELETLSFLWDAVDQACEGPVERMLEAVRPPLYEATKLMEHILARRARAQFSEHPEVNELMLAGAAFLSGRGDRRAVDERLAMAEALYQDALGRFATFRRDLDPEYRKHVQVGFRHFKAGLQQAREGGDLQAALRSVRDGAELVGYFLKWERETGEASRRRRSRYAVPVIGPDLELALEQGRRLDRAQWTRGVENLESIFLPRLRAFWQVAQPCLVLPPERDTELLNAVDLGLEALHRAVGRLLDPSLSGSLVLDEFQRSVEDLAAAFEAIQAEALRGDRLWGDGALYWEAAVGALSGSVPLVALEELLELCPLPWGDLGFRAYVATGDRFVLVEGLTRLLELAAPAAEVSSDWVCVYCACSNPQGERRCRRCTAEPAATRESGLV